MSGFKDLVFSILYPEHESEPEYIRGKEKTKKDNGKMLLSVFLFQLPCQKCIEV